MDFEKASFGVTETNETFENRKKDHIRLSLNPENEAVGFAGFNEVELIHDSLPEIDFSEVDLSQNIFNLKHDTPFLISSMTAGHVDSVDLNIRLAKACEKNKWLMGVGSQRKELFCDKAASEWDRVLKQAKDVKLIGNIGLSQLIKTPKEQIKNLIEALHGVALFVHTNPLQECLQSEGTPFFKGGLEALKNISDYLTVPVILKETGCGFSSPCFKKINGLGLYAVDVAGFGGTHWGRIEGARGHKESLQNRASINFSNWGISTVKSLLNAKAQKLDYSIWASGGVRTGVHAAQLLALGAEVVGLAKPMLVAALKSEDCLDIAMKTVEYELKVAMFCTGSKTIGDLRSKVVL